MCRSSLLLLNRVFVVIRDRDTRAVAFDQRYLLGTVSWMHVEVEQQPVGGVLDRLRQAGFPPRLPECSERPMVDMDGDGHRGLGIDAHQADDGTEIDDPVDADA